MSHPPHNAKSRVAAISILASASMAAAKFAVGIAIGSLALISEALHSSVDLAATIVTWERGGHSCVMASRDVPAHTLERLAAWRADGSIPY